MTSTVRLQGPHGVYELELPHTEDGQIEVVYGDLTLRWVVQVMDGPMSSASGLTVGTEAIWGDVFWFEFIPGPSARINYYGNGVLVRTDHEAAA